MHRDRISVLASQAVVGITAFSAMALCATVLSVIPQRPALSPPAPLRTPRKNAVSPNIEGLRQRGNGFFARGLYAEAAAEYGRMIHAAPADPSGYWLRGLAEVQMGEYARAIRSDTAGLQVARDTEMQSRLYYSRGLARRADWEYGPELPRPAAVAAQNRDAERPYRSRAFCYARLGMFGSAGERLPTGQRLAPDTGDRWERGQVYREEPAYRLALSDFDASVNLRPNFYWGHWFRAMTHADIGEVALALADAKELVRLHDSAANRGALGWYEYLAGHISEAIENSRTAIRRDPNSTFAWFNLGLCYAARGDRDAMIRAYDVAIMHGSRRDIRVGLKDVNDALVLDPNSQLLSAAASILKTAAAR